jgi:hypothetical protein
MVPESPLSPRDARYKDQSHRMVRERDRYRSIAIDAVAALIVGQGDDLDLLDGVDLLEAQQRAADLRARMSGRTRR